MFKKKAAAAAMADSKPEASGGVIPDAPAESEGGPTTMPVALPEEMLKGYRSNLEALANAPREAAERMRAILREIQWSGPTVQLPTHRRVGTCPRCFQHQTHAEGCDLKAEIG